MIDPRINTIRGNLRIVSREYPLGNATDKNIYYQTICVECDNIKIKRWSAIKKMSGTGCVSCNKRNGLKEEFLNKKFGRITITKFLGSDQNYKLIWEGLCDCSDSRSYPTSTIRRNKTNENWSCNSCARSKHNDEEFIWHQIYNERKGAAKHRKLEWLITMAEFKTIVSNNCTYCGAPPVARKRTRGWTDKSRSRKSKDKDLVKIKANSIDRRDSMIGYTKANCLSSCDLCNQMKSDLSVSEFLNWVKRLSEFRESL